MHDFWNNRFRDYLIIKGAARMNSIFASVYCIFQENKGLLIRIRFLQGESWYKFVCICCSFSSKGVISMR